MDYEVVVTGNAEEDPERFIQYRIFEKKSLQAAGKCVISLDPCL